MYAVIDLVYARVRKADGTVVETPQASVQDVTSAATRQAPTYSDLREAQIPVKALAVGDVLEYRIRIVWTKAEVPGQFWYEHEFVKTSVVLEETLRISVPAGKYVQVKSTTVQPEVQEAGGRKIYLWKTAHLDPSAPENPKKKAAAQTPQPPAVELTTFRNWEEVGRWYGQLARPRAVVTPAKP
jgi:LysM repeat protein